MTLDLDRSKWEKVSFGDVVRNVNDNVKDPAAELRPRGWCTKSVA